ncbi:glycoside hydrolase family 88 protein [uncultured Bacteroides sp.]|uniref:glycoside hydrolase family 88/105 protein n=1 Tax=uncultured Bacteroides sp. TaxID=162156 RepID=UPI00260B8B7D|nr:glycoside hydrolase family 88 protein [uncultured Bacteroides sp.]
MTRKIVIGVCIWCMGSISLPAVAQNRVVNQRTTGTVVEGEVTMLVTQETTTRYRRTTSQGVSEAKLGYTPGVTPPHLALPLAETVMARYPDYRMAYWKDYTYVQGYMFEAMDRLGQLTADNKYLEYMKAYIDHFVDENGNYRGGALTNLDNFMTGSAFCTLYHRTGNEKYKKAALQILAVVDKYPSSDGQFWHGNRSPNMWIDGVFMMQIFLIRCAQYVGEADYCYDVTCRNIMAAARHLQRPDGLVLHAWTTEPEKAAWADKSTGLSPEVWSEGMGWYTLIVPELLAALPKTHKDYQSVLDIYLKMCKGLKDVQDKKTGGWFMVVDKGENPLNFIDPSGTAMFVYSIRRGVQLGLLKAKEYAQVAEKGYKSLFPFIQVNDRGLLDVIGACDGVVIKKNFVEYVTVPKILNAKEAVAGILWASVIMETEQLKK